MAGLFTCNFGSYNLLSFMACLQDGSDHCFHFIISLPLYQLPSVALTLLGCRCSPGFGSWTSLLTKSQAAFCSFSGGSPWDIPFLFLGFSSLPSFFIPGCWKVLCMQSSFCRLGPNCVSESTEAIFPCNKYTSRDA